MDPTAPPRPDDEARRLAAVRRYDVLDTPPDGAFDRITALAARLCRVPISTITIVDEDRIWFRSSHGVEVEEIGRDAGLCASAILHDGPYVVADAASDPRTLAHPLVRGELGLRFYAAAPLMTEDGHRLGTLNIIDVEPRAVTDDELAHLQDLAAVVMDELELRRSARHAVELEAAREAARFREALMDGISHEMRTPIAVLQGIAGLDPEDEAVGVAELQHMMARHVLHLEWLINQYLDFTHLEAGHVPRLTAEPLDLGAVAEEAVAMTTEGIDIEIAVDGEVPPAMGSHTRVLQIFSELLNNAVRFSPEAGTVRVTVRAPDERHVTATVTDDGPGLTREEAERAFERFYQGRVSQGAGIGLYVSRALAEAQGGRLDVDTTVARGASFTLTLPVADDAAARPRG